MLAVQLREKVLFDQNWLSQNAGAQNCFEASGSETVGYAY
jgi:hypothetical protein